MPLRGSKHASRLTMQPTLEIRRHGDGSIDYDFYRRRAERRRRIAGRMIVKHYLAAGGRLARANACMIASGMIDPSWQRLLARAGAVAAVLIAAAAFQVWAQGNP
jgi:hypothetical protein